MKTNIFDSNIYNVEALPDIKMLMEICRVGFFPRGFGCERSASKIWDPLNGVTTFSASPKFWQILLVLSYR